MQLHSVALRSATQSDRGFAAEGIRMNALLATLGACKRYFDTFLACPPSDYYILGFAEWFRIPAVVITLARLCIASEAHDAVQWDVKAAHERGRLDLYLESLCYRMKSLSTYKRTQNFHIDFYWALEMLMDMTKTWFMKKINVKKPVSNDIPTPDTLQGLSHSMLTSDSGNVATTEVSGGAGCPHSRLESEFAVNCNAGRDPFEFMQTPDFDMDK